MHVLSTATTILALTSCLIIADAQKNEAYFLRDSYLVLNSVLNLQYTISFSFKSCSSGTILKQQGDSGDSISISLKEPGSLEVSIKSGRREYFNILDGRFNNNEWHNFVLNLQLGVLSARIGNNIIVIANTTSDRDILSSDFSSINYSLIVGSEFEGCVIGGASVLFTQHNVSVNVDWDGCPLPDGKSCWEYNNNYCFNEPCHKRGVCLSQESGYQCICPIRFTGEQCQIDNGPLCNLPQFSSCQNGGRCQENPNGNETNCICPSGYMGEFCESSIDHECLSLNCENDGTCMKKDDQTQCVCMSGFTGKRCEFSVNQCDSSPCLHNGVCIEGVGSHYTCDCSNTGYHGQNCEIDIDECQQLLPCENGGTCHDLYGDYFCQCSSSFSGKNCEIDLNECLSQPCQNNGTCIDLPNFYQCICPEGFTGSICQTNINDCSTASCPPQTRCIDGTNSYTCGCLAGYTGIPPDCVEFDECLSNPCHNGGHCVDHHGGFSCSCLPGFTGVTCDVDIDECSLVVCANGGKCVDGINSYHCECQQGFIGKNCQAPVTGCSSGTCLNGGTCDSLHSTCKCPEGFSGNRCEEQSDYCSPNPCANGGSCTSLSSNYLCDCPESYSGINCTEPVDPCSSSPCQNSASCIRREYSPGYYCECIEGFEGLHCENNINDCLNVKCPDGKQCFDLIKSYECRCLDGYTGDQCETNINDCQHNPCQNNGTCVDAVANYSCVCNPGYTGRNCEEDIDECKLLKPCLYGICQNTIGSFQCYCRPGFSGDRCNLDFDECLSHPCQNNASCENLINGYKCHCQPGFSGRDCQENINECAPDPCRNGATCIDQIAAFECVCLAGFTGHLCEINIDECESDPCMNNGVCIDGIDGFRCDCEDTGFTGSQCEINIDDCEALPCVHNSTCVDKIKDYECQCFSGFSGKNCEVDEPECLSLPCQNGGVCMEKSNRTLYETNFMGLFPEFQYSNAGGYICICDPGFTGTDCETNINECESSPCQNGHCIDLVNQFACQCHPGYEGVLCEQEIDECSRYSPCVNGECLDQVADYLCDCHDQWGGKNCSVQLVGCVGVSCQNDGVCKPYVANEVEHGFNCECPHGYYGQLCEAATTLSFQGDSHVVVTTSKTENYELRLRFRTTLKDGLLALGQGSTYFRLEVSNGSLNLHSSLLNKWGGIFTGEGLNTGDWQSVVLQINSSTIVLSCGNESCSVSHELEPSGTNNTFPITVIGGYTPNLKVVARNLSFVGCMQDVVVNDLWVVSQYTESMFFNTVEGCARKDQCHPNPCQNDGLCHDMWTSHVCECKRPYLGIECAYSYNPATFGYENTSISLALSEIPSELRPRLSELVDISLFVRTRQEQGVIFYVGSTQSPRHDISWPDSSSYIVLELRNGKLGVRVMLAETEQRFLVDKIVVNDGNYHLVRVLRDHSNLTVYVNETVYLEGEIEASKKLNAEILALGGLPRELEHINRRKRSTNSLGYFKGTLLDIRLGDGVEERNIEIFPLENDIPRAASIPTVETVGLVIGSPSDDTCRDNPCQNGAKCQVTWNDYFCECTKGFRGKTCSQLQYCELYQCPEGSACVNHEQEGYDCLSNITLTNSQIAYRRVVSGAIPNIPPTITLNFRTQKGGELLFIKNDNDVFSIILRNDSIILSLSSQPKIVLTLGNITDGEWHSIFIEIVDNEVLYTLDEVELLQSLESGSLVNLSELLSGEVIVGGSADMAYEGCVGEMRIGGVLLPFFLPDLLSNNSSPVQFAMTTSLDILRDCILCRDTDCHHASVCIDPGSSYDCLCPPGYDGQYCQYDIDECLDNACADGSVCVDGVANYTCACLAGYKGWLCDEEVDECASSPCLNSGECLDMIANYSCNCSQEYKGYNCEAKKTCIDAPCPEGVPCKNVQDTSLSQAADFICECPHGYSGRFCTEIYDFCEDSPCRNGGQCISFPLSGFQCECLPGFRGNNCDINIDECASQPCLNGGTCLDMDNRYNCTCFPGFEGDNCEKDIDECAMDNPCHNGATCINEIPGYVCQCPEAYCGQICDLENPCLLGHECQNEGICQPICNEVTSEVNYVCECSEDYTGPFCAELAGPAFLDSPPIALIVGPLVGAMLLIALVGLIIFVMMARKKRATRGTYSPSRQEMYGSRVEMGNVMKPPPEERLI